MGKKGQRTFSSPKECIRFAANNLAKNDGYYYGRGRYTISQIGKRYAADKKWSARVVATMKGIR